ncbi:MAG: DUF5680 domain-containing protein [Candidatus Pacebacteria bacterium]|nr:DUF5680 domain-containing protein [Candidatus Paceibacterota bacterium]
MDIKKKLKILYEARIIFFKALLAGYAGKSDKKDPRLTKTISMFGFEKTNTYRYGNFIVVDRWTVSDHSNISSGTTVILFVEVPVWIMTYSGSYPKNVIPFLKEALSEQYKTGEFRGGRGPYRWVSEKFLYRNNVHENEVNNFSCFSGHEEIVDQKTGKVLGFHEYSGMSMIE